MLKEMREIDIDIYMLGLPSFSRVEKLRIFLGVSPGAFNIGVHEPFS